MNNKTSLIGRLIGAISWWWNRPPYPRGYVFAAPAKSWEPPAWFMIAFAIASAILTFVVVPVYAICKIFK